MNSLPSISKTPVKTIAKRFGSILGVFLFLWGSCYLNARDCVVVEKVHENADGVYLRSVAYHDGHWLAVGGQTVLMSTDGQEWVPLDSGFEGSFVDIVWAGDRFALLGRSTVTSRPTLLSWTSSDGFVEYESFFSFGIPHALGWNGVDTLIIAYYHSLFEFTFFATTTDYVTASSNVNMGPNCGFAKDMDLVNGLSVMGIDCRDLDFIGYRGVVKYSYDGTLYETEPFGPYESFGAGGLGTNGEITFANGIYYPPGSQKTYYLFSHTPHLGFIPMTTYQDLVETFRHTMHDSDWIDSLFVGVGPANKIGFSPDGLNWNEIRSPNKGEMRRVVPTLPNQFVAVGEGETILVGRVLPNDVGWEDWPSVDCLELLQSFQICGFP